MKKAILAASILLIATATGVLAAQTLTVLHHFGGGIGDGATPWCGNILVQGTNLFGMTRFGGAASSGVIFELHSDGTGYTNLHEFSNVDEDGNDPRNSLTASGATLYGTTQAGGKYGGGTVFSISADGSGYSQLHSFSGPDGDSPHGDVLPYDGQLLGLTRWGGASGLGVVFSLSTLTGDCAVLHSFTGNTDDGSWPHFGITRDGSTLYGQTYMGGTNGDGTVWRMNVDGSGYTNLHSFSGPDGIGPHGYVRLIGNILYGLAPFGGTNGCGVAYRLNTDGGDFAVLHHFGSGPTDGVGPYDQFEIVNGILYGTTSGGGTNGFGTIFRINPDGSGYSVLHSFDGVNGAQPLGSLALGPDGLFYGMTQYGGTNGFGVVFSFSLPAVPPVLAISYSNGLPRLSLAGEVGRQYALEFVTELPASNNWQSVMNLTNVVLTNSPQYFLDTDCGNIPQRFYRAVLLP
jgi:uncharacterized repeat protein (TIGR03803 family)